MPCALPDLQEGGAAYHQSPRWKETVVDAADVAAQAANFSIVARGKTKSARFVANYAAN
jgi:hypothetical protein